MSLLDESFESATTVIGVRNEKGNVAWIGTGFFVSVKNMRGPGRYIYLVTNRHVIEGLKSIVIRAHLKNGEIASIDAPLIVNDKHIFLMHHNSNIDIAIIPLSGNYIDNILSGISSFYMEENVYLAEEYLAEGGFEGSSVFMLGFPMGIVDKYSTTPICRKGCIARFKINDIRNNYNFWLDLQNYPGNSGSPIISCPDIVALEGTKILNKIMLIGIVHSYLPYRESLRNTQTNEIVEIRTENSGIALAHPVDYIKELIEEDLKRKGLG